jgi:hypothetical protein
MSITLGDYHVETKKTVGELPLGSDDILGETPCEAVIDDSTVQPKWKKIHQYNLAYNAVLRPSLLYEISGSYFLPDGVFADGYDYELIIDNITFTGSGVSPINVIINRISYTLGGNNWWHSVLNGAVIAMNENNCGGSYANTNRVYQIGASSADPFNLDIQITIKQLIPATIEIELCGGGTTTNLTELKQIDEVITVITDESEEPVSVISTKRQTPYDPYSGGFEEIAKLPKTCLGYSVYYVGSLFSSPYFAPNDKTYWIDSGIYEIKIDIPKSPPQSLDFKLFDGTTYVFDESSDVNGLIDWQTWSTTSGVNTSLEIWEALLNVQETSSAEQYVYFKYDLTSYDCPCTECGSDCGEVTVIFHQNCGTSYPLKFNLMIQEGKYNVEGETFTQGNELITPITKIQANYDFVISEYSDETYLLLMELIADNILIEVVDNIDTGNPTTLYYINKESFAPNWNYNSKLGSLTLPVIKKNSIRTSRRNCCN